MSKGLEALERYRFLPTRIDYDIIEKELKRLGKIDDLLERYSIVDLNRLEMILREASETKMSLEDIKRGIDNEV